MDFYVEYLKKYHEEEYCWLSKNQKIVFDHIFLNCLINPKYYITNKDLSIKTKICVNTLQKILRYLKKEKLIEVVDGPRINKDGKWICEYRYICLHPETFKEFANTDVLSANEHLNMMLKKLDVLGIQINQLSKIKKNITEGIYE